MRKLSRILCLALCLCLLAPSALAEFTGAAFYERLMDTDYDSVPNVMSMAALGDTLYLLQYDYSSEKSTLATWKPGEEAPTATALELAGRGYVDLSGTGDEIEGLSITRLFSDGARVYGLDAATGRTWTLADGSGPLAEAQEAVTLAWDGMRRTAEDYEYVPDIVDICAWNGTLYLCSIDWEQDGYAKYETHLWDLATGAATKTVDDQFIHSLTPYKDGKLLCVVRDEAHSWDEKTQTSIPATVGLFDPATGTVETLCTLTSTLYILYGLRYVEAKDAVYGSYGGKVYRLNLTDGTATVAAYLPVETWEDNGYCMLDGGVIVVNIYSGVYARLLDAPGVSDGVLTVYGEYGSDQHMKFVSEHPEVPVAFSQTYYSSLEAFTNAMVSGTDNIDVLRLSASSSPLARLIDKGYAMDLSASAELMALVQEMYPTLADLCMRDGKLYAVPVEIYGRAMGYDTDALEELGIDEKDLPKTFYELLDFVENWAYDYGEDHPDIGLFNDTSAKSSLLSYLLDNYFTYCAKQGTVVDLGSELFTKLMKKLDGIDFSQIDPERDENGNVADENDFWSRTTLFDTYSIATNMRSMRGSQRVLALPLDEGLETVITTETTVLLINPRTTRPEQAMEYVQGYAQCMSATSEKITMFPSNNEPVVNESFDKDLEEWKKSLEQEKAALETSEPEDVSWRNENIEYWEKRIANADDYRYDVSAESIADYRANIAPYLVAMNQTPLNTWDENGQNDLYTQIQQYLDGALTAEQFIKEAGNRLRMMALEDE